jgi:tripartite-type tricarboxylate transporter receptor subunit TctC
MSRLVFAAVLVAVSALSAPSAWAQQYPQKNIEFVIPFGTGGGFDRTVRLISPALERALPHHVQVIPKNVPGAGGRKGMAQVYRAKPDGYTIVIANMPGAALPALLGEKVAYDLKKFTWIARVAGEEYMLGVPAKSSIKSIDDLKKLGRPIKVPTTGFGSTAFAAGAIIMKALNIPVNHLTGYKGTNQYIVATIRGDADVALAPVSTYEKFIKSGDIRPILTTQEKSTVGADVPTIAKLGHPELTGLGIDRYVLAPPGLPDNITKILSDSLAKAMKDPKFVEAAKKTGETVAFLDADNAKKAAQNSLALYSKYKDVIGRH